MEALPIQWIRDVPIVTRGYILCSLAVGVCHHAGFQLPKPSTWPSNDSVANILQVFDNGTISAGLVTNLYFFSQYAATLEVACDSTGEFIWEWMVVLTLSMGYSTWVQQISSPSAILRDVFSYIWIMTAPDTDMALLGIFFFKAKYLPWLLIFVSKFFGERKSNSLNGGFNWKADLTSIIIGHTYWFIKDQLPRLHSIKSPFLPPWLFFQHQQEPVQIDDGGNASDNADVGDIDAPPPNL